MLVLERALHQTPTCTPIILDGLAVKCVMWGRSVYVFTRARPVTRVITDRHVQVEVQSPARTVNTNLSSRLICLYSGGSVFVLRARNTNREQTLFQVFHDIEGS